MEERFATEGSEPDEKKVDVKREARAEADEARTEETEGEEVDTEQ